MQIGVLASPDSWYLADLRRAAHAGETILAAEFSQLASRIDGQGERISAAGVELDRLDAVLVRSMPPASLEQVVVRMDMLARLAAEGVAVINPPRALEGAIDKYLATSRLRGAGLPTPRTVVCESPEAAITAFEALGGDVVVKPLFGSEGRGLARLQDPALAERAFRMLAQLRAVVYLQEFLPHEGYDIRVFLCGNHALAMRRSNPHDWRTNVSRGAQTSIEPLQPRLLELAERAREVMGAPVVGVDLLPARDGQTYVLEVNAVPGWKALAATHQVDVARLVLDFVHTQRR
ncbi:MAG: RimK family alpha-L-glutamate ligase [Pirellulales bacterium]|nr:RimK family alpha-L-glutamate ligase [Pirellulales bacterium]